MKKIGIKERRDLAYWVMAKAMFGSERGEFTDEVVGAAMTIVLDDDRKNRTAKERSVQMWVRGVAMVSMITDPKFAETVTQFGDAASGSLLATSAEPTT